MDVEYRWGIWSPPHVVWDLVTQYVGFVREIMKHSKTYWTVFQALRDSNIPGAKLIDIHQLLPNHYHDFIRKEHLLQFDLLPNGNFVPDVGWDAFFSGLSVYLDDVVYDPWPTPN